jgi:hypothetical protein
MEALGECLVALLLLQLSEFGLNISGEYCVIVAVVRVIHTEALAVCSPVVGGLLAGGGTGA